MSYREFEPVQLPVERVPERYSQTLLRYFDRCKRAAFFYARDGGGPGSHEMYRGAAFHEIVKALVNACVDAGEPTIPGDLAKAIVDEVLDAHPEWTLPLRERDRLRALVWRWAEHTALDPEKIVAVERKLVLEVDGREVSGIVDFAELDGRTIDVRDWKTQLYYPDQETFEAGFQLPFYAVLLAFASVDGFGPIADGVEFFRLSEVYPAVELRDGGLAVRSRVMTRLEVQEAFHDVRRLVRELDHAVASGGWPAVAGSHCSVCPAPAECPIPVSLRNHAGEINEAWQAAEAAEWHERTKARLGATWTELKRFASAHGPVRFGADRVLEFQPQESASYDHEGLEVGVERAVRFGEPFDLEEFRRRRVSTRFQARTLTPEELEPEAGSLDERYGVEAPY